MTPREWKWCRRVFLGIALNFLLIIGSYQTPTQRALERIEELGGFVNHDTWIVSTVYPYITLNDTAATDDDMRHVVNLDPCHCVNLRNTQVTDQGAAALCGLKISYLDLRGTSVTLQMVQKLRGSIRGPDPVVRSDYDRDREFDFEPLR